MVVILILNIDKDSCHSIILEEKTSSIILKEDIGSNKVKITIYNIQCPSTQIYTPIPCDFTLSIFSFNLFPVFCHFITRSD